MGRRHAPPSGGRNGYGAWNNAHLLRSLLGLPVPPRAFIHPDFREAHDLARKNANRDGSAPTRVTTETVGDERLESRKEFDPVVFDNADTVTPTRVALEGDVSVYSFGTAEDFWFAVVNQWSWASLILGEIVLEATSIFSCAAVLTLVAILEGRGGVDAHTLGANLLLSLSTVRLSTDKIFGWNPTEPSSEAEVFVLAVFGWLHWLLMSVASAAIVARALRPARSAVFSPDAVVNEDSLQVRFMCLRNQTQGKLGFLYNLEFTLQGMTVGGQTLDFPLRRSKYATWLNSNNVITLRHDVRDPSSPLCESREGGREKLLTLFATLTAVDIDGNSVLHTAIYHDPLLLDPDVEASLRPFPRILYDHKFVDMYRMARHPETGELAVNAPKFVCNLDNFIRVEPVRKDEPGFTTKVA